VQAKNITEEQAKLGAKACPTCPGKKKSMEKKLRRRPWTKGDQKSSYGGSAGPEPRNEAQIWEALGRRGLDRGERWRKICGGATGTAAA
jgi:hypothetical protein